MAYVAVPGNGMWLPQVPTHNIAQVPPSGTNFTLDKTGQKFAWIGRVWNVDHSSKSIQSVGFPLSLSTLGSTTSFTLSLQDVSSTGSPMRPDEVQDQFVTFSTTDPNFTTPSIYFAPAFSANRSVNYGDLLSVVIEFSSAGVLGADNLKMLGVFIGSQQRDQFSGCTSRSTGGTWSFEGSYGPMMFLKFSDGTYGSLDFAWMPGSSSPSQNIFTTGQERGMRFTIPFNCKIDGVFVNNIFATSSSDMNLILYSNSGATVVETIRVNALQTSQSVNTAAPLVVPLTAEREITAGGEYILSIQSTNQVMAYYGLNPSSDAYAQGFYNSSNFYLASRNSSGASWTFDDLTFPFMGVRVSAVDDGTGAPPTLEVNNNLTFVSDVRDIS